MRISINKNIIAIVFVVLAMCASMQMYFTWELPLSAVNLACAIVLLPYLSKLKIRTSAIFFIFLIFLIFLYNYTHNTIEFSILSFVNFIAVFFISLFVFLSENNFKLKLYRSFDIFIKSLCAISLLGWILYLAGVSLPNYHSNTSDFYEHEVYYLFVINTQGIWDFLPRFAGMFLEPGHIGSTACLLLYINKFNFKDKSNYIYLLSIILSLSLAAYGLFFIGLIVYLFFRGINIMRYFIFAIVLAYSFYLLGITYNHGDNVINDKILSRLIIEDGELLGDNRTSMIFDFYYEKWLKGGNLLSGYGKEAYGDNSKSTNLLHGTASYKRFFFINGLIGVALVLLLYGLWLCKYYSRQGLGFFVVFLICNMIRDYPLRLMWLFIFVLGIVKFALIEREQRFSKENNSILN